MSILIENVSYAFMTRDTAFAAVQNVTYALPNGTVASILGPTGCGKSTLLRCIAGLLIPSSGRIAIDDQNPVDLHTIGSIGFSFQDVTLLPWLTVHDNIGLPLALGTKPESLCLTANVNDLMKLMRLTEFGSSLPRQLSGGMKRRVALARALVRNPRVLLLDEPLTGLDVVIRTELMAEMSALFHGFRCSGFVVTHDIEEAVFLGSQVVIMSGHPGSILAKIDSPFPWPRTAALFEDSLFQSVVSRCRSTLFGAR